MKVVAIAAVCCGLAPVFDSFNRGYSRTRQQQCESNIHNVALAVLGYYDVNGTFPGGTIPNANLRPSERLGLYAPITPYLDFQDLYDTIDQTLPWDGGFNGRLASERIGVLICPGSARAAPGTPQPTTTIGIAGLGSMRLHCPKRIRALAFLVTTA